MAAMMPELKFELPQAYIESQVKLAEEIIHELCRQERISERSIRVWVDNDDTYCVGLYIATEDAGRYMALNQALISWFWHRVWTSSTRCPSFSAKGRFHG